MMSMSKNMCVSVKCGKEKKEEEKKNKQQTAGRRKEVLIREGLVATPNLARGRILPSPVLSCPACPVEKE
jgi:hypothetical protein